MHLTTAANECQDVATIQKKRLIKLYAKFFQGLLGILIGKNFWMSDFNRFNVLVLYHECQNPKVLQVIEGNALNLLNIRFIFNNFSSFSVELLWCATWEGREAANMATVKELSKLLRASRLQHFGTQIRKGSFWAHKEVNPEAEFRPGIWKYFFWITYKTNPEHLWVWHFEHEIKIIERHHFFSQLGLQEISHFSK